MVYSLLKYFPPSNFKTVSRLSKLFLNKYFPVIVDDNVNVLSDGIPNYSFNIFIVPTISNSWAISPKNSIFFSPFTSSLYFNFTL